MSAHLAGPRACALALAMAFAMPVAASDDAIGVQEVIASPEAAWQRFLAGADHAEAYRAYGDLVEVGYSLQGMAAEACADGAATLDRAVRRAPVSVAVHRARLLCAEALGDEAGAEEALEAIGGLSRIALADGRESFSPKPIRVLGPMDIYALLAGSGLEFRYQYYALPAVRRYFPLVVAVWDDVLKVERHLVFDYIDAVNAISRDDSYSGFPYQRQLLAESFVRAQAEAGESQAIDWQAIRAAIVDDALPDKLAALERGAQVGGVQSLATWLVLCASHPGDGCDEGLVDALLPHVEEGHAAHTTLLALAYAAGVGVERDAGKAAAFLDAANRRWYGDGATVLFAQTWLLLGRAPPDFLWQRIAAAATGNAGAHAASAALKLVADGVPQLTPDEVRALSGPANNGVGRGYALLANYHMQREEPRVADAWMKFAADAGDPDAQAAIGIHGFAQAAHPPQREEFLRTIALGAQGGSAFGMRYMAHQSTRRQAWADAEAWLMAAASGGNLEALLDLAEIYEWERPGIRGTQQQAVDVYTALAANPDYAEARRRLAAMALAGRGIDKDPEQAERWLLQDAGNGDGQSASELAMAYLLGEFGAVDEAKGAHWMEQAIAAGENDAYVDWGAWYFYRNGNSLASRSRALELWRKGVDAGSQGAQNNLAWAYCTAPEPEIFDPAGGLEQSERIMGWDDIPLGVLDTVAACHAAAGDFARAIEVQERVVGTLTEEEAEADREREDNFFGRLELYRAGERYVEAHRDAWPEQ